MDQLNELCKEWLLAKQEENQANTKRVAVEEKIVALTGKKEEGAETHLLGDFKITVKGVINRKMDWEKWKEVKANIPVEMQPIKMKPELDEKGVKWLMENRPDLYKLLPIEVKPGKTGVEVKVAA